MFRWLKSPQRRLQELQLLIALAQQVVQALEQTARAPGPEKKTLALQMLRELLKPSGLDPPPLLLEVALEAAVRQLR